MKKNGITNPTQIMQHAWKFAVKMEGTSTALVVYVNGTNLEASNLGDSQFILVRKDSTLMQSEEMQVEFNMPHQIGTGSDMVPDSHAKTYSIPLEEGDIVVVGSDGLFDNMSAFQITSLIKKEKSSAEIASAIAQKAFEISTNTRVSTPFEKEAQKQNQTWRGGKQDDITVIVGKVVCESGATKKRRSKM